MLMLVIWVLFVDRIVSVCIVLCGVNWVNVSVLVRGVIWFLVNVGDFIIKNISVRLSYL